MIQKEERISAKNERSGERRVFLVEDHAVVCQGIAALINLEDDLAVCGEARDGPAAVRGIQKTEPDAVIIDISLEQGSGLELIKDLQAISPGIPVLVVTMHDERVYGERALRAGASGYVMKDKAIQQVVEALREVLSGKLYVSNAMAERILSQRMGKNSDAASDPVQRLSDRELDIFRSIADWKSTREIAGSLNISIKTVEYYREQIKKKLGLRTAADLGRAALAWTSDGSRTGEYRR